MHALRFKRSFNVLITGDWRAVSGKCRRQPARHTTTMIALLTFMVLHSFSTL